MRIDFDAFEKWLCSGQCHPTFRSRYAALRMRYEQGMTYRSIGEFYGISDSRAQHIVKRQFLIAKNFGWVEED